MKTDFRCHNAKRVRNIGFFISSLHFIQEKRLLAINCLKETEDVLDCVAKLHPQWSHLLAAVDHRVDRALAFLRPKAIADHRSLLASLGWPPPLSKSCVAKSPQCLNPLLLMQGNLKNQYRENFLALCSLQEFQMRRKARQLSDFNLTKSIHQPLWVIEELVNPIALAFQNYFSKWSGKPEFIFALVYKITKDFVESMDEILQPLIDKARLVGYSCREEWISAMVSSLTTYLAKEVFPNYLSHLEDEGAGDSISQARDLWLHLIDMIISFDKQTRSLLVSTGAVFIVTEDEKLQRVSSLSVFCDRPDWLDVWAQIELSDATDKLKHELDDDRNWQKKIQESLLVSGSEVSNCPLVSGILLQLLSTLIDRCRSIPGNFLRSRFVRLAAAPLVLEFLDRLLQKCQEAEGLTSLADDDALSKVSISINAAHYCESVLKEWCEDVFFLEMAADEANNVADLSDGIFYLEMQKLNNFQTEWVEKISTVILRGFDAQIRDYVKNKKQWQEKGEEGWTVSRTFIAGLDYLQSKMSKMKQDLNDVDFVRMWRSVAGGIDHMIFYGVIMGNAKFYDAGVEKLESDLSVLFKIFGVWCVRPKGFFLKCSEGLTLLKMKEVQLREELEKGKEIWLRKNALRHLSVAEAEKIAKNRIFVS